MDIAQQKRKENIAEYILYLWQIEDLLRALDFNPERIRQVLVAPRGFSESRATLFESWYVELGNLLIKEGKRESGHMEHTLHLIADLEDLSRQLMQIPAGKEYRAHYAELAPSIPELREKLGGKNIGDIELCFRALYAAMLYRMKGEHKTVSDEVVKSVSPVVAELARIYKGVEEGTVDLSPKDDE